MPNQYLRAGILKSWGLVRVQGGGLGAQAGGAGAGAKAGAVALGRPARRLGRPIFSSRGWNEAPAGLYPAGSGSRLESGKGAAGVKPEADRLVAAAGEVGCSNCWKAAMSASCAGLGALGGGVLNTWTQAASVFMGF